MPVIEINLIATSIQSYLHIESISMSALVYVFDILNRFYRFRYMLHNGIINGDVSHIPVKKLHFIFLSGMYCNTYFKQWKEMVLLPLLPHKPT